jgi:hypothetical protein
MAEQRCRETDDHDEQHQDQEPPLTDPDEPLVHTPKGSPLSVCVDVRDVVEFEDGSKQALRFAELTIPRGNEYVKVRVQTTGSASTAKAVSTQCSGAFVRRKDQEPPAHAPARTAARRAPDRAIGRACGMQ